ncbi:MAG: extracellular solute-binding protein [Caldilinea sp.]|mgnify:CR=1 FL=1|uniref:extracellular solute-binding protein n=1 Tax=Caldilinea sp. TaxID=2293560 RepID=UPI002B98045A|nr:extracellular solute-binding protein [Anaerolineales bacterium]HQY91268.1 extracellular solute-binding protein [Caldilinea sp.]HRA66733.1 extracellular solute-binding protein [Caldilinea sp.]
MQRKSFVLLAIVALLVAACGGAPAAAPAGEQPTSGEKTVLRVWSHQNPSFIQANETVIAKFMEQNPDIEVTYEQFEYAQFIQALQTSMQAGTEADVIEMFGTWVCPYAIGGRLAGVPVDVMSYTEAQELFFAAPLDGYYCDGKLYGLPNEFNLEVGGALVNPALFEGKDVSYPPVWDNMDALREQASKLSEFDGDTMVRAGYHFVGGDGLPFLLLEGILEQGGNYFAEDGKHFTFDTPESIATIQLLTDMVQKDKLVDPVLFNNEANQPYEGFFAGVTASSFIGSWAAGAGKVDYPDLVFDYVNVPPLFGMERKFAADAGWGKVVSANSKHQEAAWKLVQFMAAEQENALTFNAITGTIPALKALVENPQELLAQAPWIEPTFSLLPYGQYIGNLTDRDKLFYEIIYAGMLQSLQGSMTPEQAAQTIHAQANEMVDAAQ